VRLRWSRGAGASRRRGFMLRATQSQTQPCSMCTVQPPTAQIEMPAAVGSGRRTPSQAARDRSSTAGAPPGCRLLRRARGTLQSRDLLRTGSAGRQVECLLAKRAGDLGAGPPGRRGGLEQAPSPACADRGFACVPRPPRMPKFEDGDLRVAVAPPRPAIDWHVPYRMQA